MLRLFYIFHLNAAASNMIVIPIMIIGWLAQKHLVRGLTFGAVK